MYLADKEHDVEIKVKRLSWAGNYALTAVCSYHVYHTDEGKYKAESITFSWYEDKVYNNKKAAMESCQRHWVKQVLDLLEGEEDEEV